MEGHRGRRPARSRYAAVLALVLALLVITSGPVSAEGADWTALVAEEPVVDFGSEVAFCLDGDTDLDVARVWLLYRLEGERARNRAAATFTAGSELEAEYVWELDTGDMAPGVTVYYYWELENEDGMRDAGPEASFAYDDGRFQWQVLSDSDLSVYYYEDRSEASKVLQAGVEALDRIEEATGMYALRPIRLYVYDSRRDMSGAIPSRSETFDSQTVTLGMSMGSDALVLLGADSGLLETTAHELSHVVIHQNADSPFADLPVWLDEGLAMFSEGEMPTDNARALRRAISQGSLISLRSMTSYPGDANLVDLYYGQAYSIVAYMLDEYDSNSMHDLLALLADGVQVETSMQQAYGFGLEELEAGWLDSLGVETEPVVSSTITARQ